jgi:hypothetical protein
VLFSYFYVLSSCGMVSRTLDYVICMGWGIFCHNPTLGHSHSRKMGLGSPLGLPKTQNSIAGAKTPHIEVFFYIVGNFLKCKCPKWPHMKHLDISSTSYNRKKGQKLNWQFDF